MRGLKLQALLLLSTLLSICFIAAQAAGDADAWAAVVGSASWQGKLLVATTDRSIYCMYGTAGIVAKQLSQEHYQWPLRVLQRVA